MTNGTPEQIKVAEIIQSMVSELTLQLRSKTMTTQQRGSWITTRMQTWIRYHVRMTLNRVVRGPVVTVCATRTLTIPVRFRGNDKTCSRAGIDVHIDERAQLRCVRPVGQYERK
jgi:predicted phage tail protein